MFGLFELFIVPSLRSLAWAIFGEAAGFFVLRKMGTPTGEALGMVLAFGGMGVTVYLLQLFPKNLSWLMGLPYSKRQLAAIHYLINAVVVLLAGTSQFLLAGVLVYLTVEQKHSGAIQKLLQEWSHYPIRAVVVLPVLLVFALFFNMLCLSVFVPMTRPLSKAATARFRLYAAGGFGICAVAAQLGWAQFLDYPVVAFCGMVLFLNIAPLESMIRALAIESSQALRYRSVASALAVAQCLSLVGLMVHAKDSGDALQVAEAVSMLGALGGPVADASLVQALESPSSPFEFFALRQVADLYRKQHSQGLTIQNAIRAKTSDDQVAAVMRAFDPDQMTLAELLPLFVWLERKLGELSPDAQRALYSFVKVPRASQVKTMLASQLRAMRELALVSARYNRQPELIGDIEAWQVSHASNMTARERDLAFVTLAILKGSHRNLDGDRSVASAFYPEPECAGLNAEAVKSGSNSISESMLNVCFRKVALERGAGAVRQVEAQGWLSWPLNDDMRKLALYLLSRANYGFEMPQSHTL